MKKSKLEQGSVLIWTVIVLAILSMVGLEVMRVTSAKHVNAMQSATWQEALVGAESGIDLAVVQLRKSLYPAPNHAWEGWKNVPGAGVVSHGLTTITNAGLNGVPMTIEVNVDAPASLKDLGNGWQYYRIRTTGSLPLNGPVRANDNKADTRLRRLSLRADRFTDGVLASHAITTPEAARRTEVVVKPTSAFDQAIMSVGSLNLTDHDIIIDSYDSRDPLKSTNGLYDASKFQKHGNIATDGAILNAGNAHVFGDVSTNAGRSSGITNISGVERTDFYQDPIPVGAPSWWGTQTPMTITRTTPLPAGSEGSPARYEITSVTLAGTDVLTFTGHPDGSPSYIEIYISGDVSVTGNGQVILAPGVKAKIYFAGNFNVAGNGVVNQNQKPGDLLFYGISPVNPATARSFAIAGNSLLSAAVYAPAYDVQINNGGTRGTVYGSFVGKTVVMNGVTDLHYDEALGAGGVINSYKIVSWFEDTR